MAITYSKYIVYLRSSSYYNAWRSIKNGYKGGFGLNNKDSIVKALRY